jgi:hypothetical protein
VIGNLPAALRSFRTGGYRRYQGRTCTLRSKVPPALCSRKLDFETPAHMTLDEFEEWLAGHGLESPGWTRLFPGIVPLAMFSPEPEPERDADDDDGDEAPPEHLVVDIRDPALPVSLFVREGGLYPCADSLDAFLSTLAARGVKALTRAQLERIHDRAQQLIGERRWPEAVESLADAFAEPDAIGDASWRDVLLTLRAQCLAELGRHAAACEDLAHVGRGHDARVGRAALMSLHLGRHGEGLALIETLLADSYVVIKPWRVSALRRARAFARFHQGDASRAAAEYAELFEATLTPEEQSRTSTALVETITPAVVLSDLERLERAGIEPAEVNRLKETLARKQKLRELLARRRS